MAGDEPRGALYRPRVPNQHSRVTYAELFFDLVFVFAVTQISHTLLGRFTPLGALQTTEYVAQRRRARARLEARLVQPQRASTGHSAHHGYRGRTRRRLLMDQASR